MHSTRFQRRIGLARGIAVALLALAMTGQVWAAAPPVVSNVRASQRAGTQLVDVYYDLADADSGALTVSIAVSTNGGASYTAGAANFTGALGAGLAPGGNKKITWNAGVDLPARLFSNVRVSVTASDEQVPSGMALIPAGSFTMGNCMSTNEGSANELPMHTVYVSAFYMDRYEVTKALWDDVYNWATNHGYSFDNPGSWTGGVYYNNGANHPVHLINWYDCVKWCNARCEKVGRVPAYYTNAAQTVVYRRGQVNVDNSWVKWNAGYRLPTEAEWEKAARGGAGGHRFAWGDTDNIMHNQANYYSLTNYSYDVSPTRGYHPTFEVAVYPYTNPVGYFAPNGYGLHDMAGNVWEWCWDWYENYSTAAQTDPRSLASGPYRVSRGGGWTSYAVGCRVAYRDYRNPTDLLSNIGFRLVLPLSQP